MAASARLSEIRLAPPIFRRRAAIRGPFFGRFLAKMFSHRCYETLKDAIQVFFRSRHLAGVPVVWFRAFFIVSSCRLGAGEEFVRRKKDFWSNPMSSGRSKTKSVADAQKIAVHD